MAKIDDKRLEKIRRNYRRYDSQQLCVAVEQLLNHCDTQKAEIKQQREITDGLVDFIDDQKAKIKLLWEQHKQRIDKQKAEIDEFRRACAGLKKTHQWLDQLRMEADVDEDAITSASGAFADTLDTAINLADPEWTETYLDRVVGASFDRARQQNDIIQRQAERIEELLSGPWKVCLCGSTRFMDAFFAAGWELTLLGQIVLTIGVCKHATDHGAEALGDGVAARLDELHCRKIDLANWVLVLNIGGYIGDSTRNEIAYAKQTNKPVVMLFSEELMPMVSTPPEPDEYQSWDTISAATREAADALSKTQEKAKGQ